MSSAKLRIDLQAGVVDVEGPVDFVQKVYDEFKEDIRSSTTRSKVSPKRTSSTSKSKPNEGAKTQAKSSASANKRTKKHSLSLLTSLDLSGGEGKPRLKEYFARYAPTTNYERNLVFGYYLQEVLKEKPLTPDHIFTCYRLVGGVKVPKALEQSLRDTESNKGWLEFDGESISVSVAGINYVEHDMPVSKKGSE